VVGVIATQYRELIRIAERIPTLGRYFCAVCFQSRGTLWVGPVLAPLDVTDRTASHFVS